MWIEQRGESVRLSIRAQPRASRTEVVGLHGDALRVRVAAPPVEGEANDELIRFLARRLRVAPSRVAIVSGASARTKIVEVSGVAADDVARALLP